MSKWHIPFRAHGEDPSAGRAWGREGGWRAARAVHRLRARARESAIAGPGPEPGLGAGGGGGCARGCARGCAWETVPACARVELPAGPQLFPRATVRAPLPSALSLAHWPGNNKKEGEKAFQKKLIAQRR